MCSLGAGLSEIASYSLPNQDITLLHMSHLDILKMHGTAEDSDY